MPQGCINGILQYLDIFYFPKVSRKWIKLRIFETHWTSGINEIELAFAVIQSNFKKLCYVMLCYVMWNLFTVGSLQFPNDSTIVIELSQKSLRSL